MDIITQQALEQAWFQHCRSIGATETTAIAWKNELFKEYERRGRFYHTLKHIKQMLDIASEQQAEFTTWPTVFFAIWFHDVVQDCGADNELKSAELASQALSELGAEQGMIEQAYRIILSSKTHDSPNDSDCALFIDCDLSILGSATQDYRDYSQQCRQEYSVPNGIYRKGRCTFLKQLLDKPFIYHTPLFRSALEVKARSNISKELRTLGSRICN
jgi:predicted metal-dependent HD superfamily phosphohydrolase